jgi:choline dehydrogenase-like flavoprotein
MAWPISYETVAPWYTHVETFIGVCGNKDGIEAMPDGEFLPPFDLNCVEAHLQKSIRNNFSNRHLVQARWAHLTQPTALHLAQGRGKCLARNLCMRGCPYGGYFASNSATLPWAQKTGKLTIRPHSVVHSIIYDEQKGRATGVRVINAETMQPLEVFADIIFVNASALNSNLILLNSKSARFPNGLGNDSGLLGKYVMFHNYRAAINGTIDGFDDRYYFGRNPTEPIIANYRNLHRQDTDYVGGFTTFMGAYRSQVDEATLPETIGGRYKDALSEPGGWHVYMYMQGETIPKESNQVRLSDDKQDQWGIPLLVTSVGYDDNDEKMIRDFLAQSVCHRWGLHDINRKSKPFHFVHGAYSPCGQPRCGRIKETKFIRHHNTKQPHLTRRCFEA